MLMQSLRCYASLWPPHVYPWKGIPLEGVWREGKRGRDVLGYPYTLAPRYLLKETLVTVGYPLPPLGPFRRAWISMGRTGLDFHCPMGLSMGRTGLDFHGAMDPSTGLVFHGPVDGPIGTVGPSTE